MVTAAPRESKPMPTRQSDSESDAPEAFQELLGKLVPPSELSNLVREELESLPDFIDPELIERLDAVDSFGLSETERNELMEMLKSLDGEHAVDDLTAPYPPAGK
jgi:hypothetical protein